MPLLWIVLLSAWLGAAVLASAVVAPAAFAVLPTRTLAGALVGRVLPVLFWAGIALGLLLAFIARTITAGYFGSAVSVAFMAACGAAQLVIAPRIEAVRMSIGGPVDALDPADPRRQLFGKLHGLSVLCLGVAGIAALVVLLVLIRSSAQSNSATT
ncbi:MAG: hypothetical protein JWM95_1906 [Gemmatimonadetes bacterium]|nr:hypothetical protein [Gemmatimonadota bacterium]